MLRSLLAVSCAAALCACASDPMATSASSSGRAASATAMVAPASPDYVKMAAVADQFEIQSSRIALEKLRDADIRSFAQMMIDHHTASSAKLMSAARQAGVPASPPPALPQDKMAMLDRLRTSAVGDIDREYIDAQVRAHTEALALHTSYASGGDAAPLKMVASETVGAVQSHLERAQNLLPKTGSTVR